MARPERKKLLIVLSDGLPSNYNGSPTGKDDVRSAVDIAIRSGISVISIYFGGDYEDVTRTFAWMYGGKTDPLSATRTGLRNNFQRK